MGKLWGILQMKRISQHGLLRHKMTFGIDVELPHLSDLVSK